MASEYEALVAKVDAFTRGAFEHGRDHMKCAPGCDSCCLVWLSVNAVEAATLQHAISQLSPEARERVAARGVREREREAAAAHGPARNAADTPRCALLEDNGECVVYEHRPLVCRTQGFALRYPSGFIPEAAVRARSAHGDETYCPLNFVEQAPNPRDVLDAERVDQILAVVSQRYALANGLEPGTRHAIHALAAQACSDDDAASR